MKTIAAPLISLLLICLATSCSQIDLGRTVTQRAYVYDFSETRTFDGDATDDSSTSRYSVKVTGSISRDVVLTLYQPAANNQWVVVESIAPMQLPAGSYTNKFFGGDYYGPNRLRLVVTSPQRAQGALSIKWGIN